jgi:quinoprotein glucose dehydrogenase
MRRAFPLWPSLALGLLTSTLSLAAAPEGTPSPSATGRLSLKPADRNPVPVVAGASDEARAAMQRFRIPAGFSLSLFAAEPLLANPVAFTFDRDGTAYVAETYRYRSSVLDIRDYMPMLEEDLACRSTDDRRALILRLFGTEGHAELSKESEIVRRITDSDSDGVADGSSIFADGFNDALDGIASGVLARDGHVWFTNMPHLWRLDAADSAGRSRGRTSLSEGYGVRFGFTGHDSHGLILGPDGKIYFSFGDRGARVRTKEGTLLELPDCGAVLRCNPDGTELEIVHSGLRNPQELAFDDYGNLFTGDNDCDQGDIERWVHVVEGADSGWRVGYQHHPLGKAGPWNLEHLWLPRFDGQPAYILPPVANTPDGPSGLTYYPGTGLPDSYRGSFFMCHFRGSFTNSAIYRYQLAPEGASFRLTLQENFLSGTLPTDVDFAPDGRLYFSDWGQGWAKSSRGRLYALTHRDTVGDPRIAEVRHLFTSGFTSRATEELISLLGHANQRVRLEAQFAVAARGAAVAPQLLLCASRGPSQLARIHALWALGQIARTDRTVARDLPRFLADPDAEIQAQAVKLVGDLRLSEAGDSLIAQLKDTSPRVAFFAAQSLGKLARGDAASALLERARTNEDRDLTLRHALVMGLVGGRNFEALHAAVRDPSASVRLTTLLALRRLSDPAIAQFLTDSDSFLVAEAARAINDAPITAAQAALAAQIARPNFGEDRLFALRVLNANARTGGAAQAEALAQVAADGQQREDLRAEALQHLATWAAPFARDRIVGVFRPLDSRDGAPAATALAGRLDALLRDSSDAVVLATLNAVRLLGISSASDAMIAAALRNEASDTIRIAALEAVVAAGHPRRAEVIRAAGLATSADVRAAAQAHFRHLPAAEAFPLLVHALRQGKIVERQSALTALGQLGTAEADALLVEGLRSMDSNSLYAPLQAELLNAAESRGTAALTSLLEARNTRLATASTAQRFAFALQGGNRSRGLKLFNEHPVLACVRCHMVGGEGGAAGPALDGIGRAHPREYLVEAIVAPNATIAPGYDAVFLTRRDGSTIMGSIAQEDADAVTLRPVSGESPVRVLRADIVKRESAPSSMPEIFGTVLTRTELRDLVEYLASLTTPPARAESGSH